MFDRSCHPLVASDEKDSYYTLYERIYAAEGIYDCLGREDSLILHWQRIAGMGLGGLPAISPACPRSLKSKVSEPSTKSINDKS